SLPALAAADDPADTTANGSPPKGSSATMAQPATATTSRLSTPAIARGMARGTRHCCGGLPCPRGALRSSAATAKPVANHRGKLAPRFVNRSFTAEPAVADGRQPWRREHGTVHGTVRSRPKRSALKRREWLHIGNGEPQSRPSIEGECRC